MEALRLEVAELKEKYEAVLEENKKLKTKVKVYLVFLSTSVSDKKSTLALTIQLTFTGITDDVVILFSLVAGGCISFIAYLYVASDGRPVFWNAVFANHRLFIL
ncbi:hypothetical protein CIB84_006468 [Bambusicola thoracicus]|uniref:Uncharacterized protein n=1 Tax=Bambusicola thoracicus TaxID=9083 RepID=A0A2P4T089_BAMTH|nr:hypothetical protein CIB84_006468 [Bambusicola thoracicus]